jgi:hypothetical protein
MCGRFALEENANNHDHSMSSYEKTEDPKPENQKRKEYCENSVQTERTK